MNARFERIGITHEDERRALTAVFNGNFVAQQVKILEVKGHQVLGNHYHRYSELFYVVKGECLFHLMDVDTWEMDTVRLMAGERLILGPNIAHKVEMADGTLTVEATAQQYISPEVNDVFYEVK